MRPSFENPDDFLRDFSTVATFTTAGGALPGVRVIFDEQLMDVMLGEYRTTGSEPRALGKAEDLKSLRKHDGATFSHEPGVKYALVSDPDFDGTGWATIVLARVYNDV